MTKDDANSSHLAYVRTLQARAAVRGLLSSVWTVLAIALAVVTFSYSPEASAQSFCKVLFETEASSSNEFWNGLGERIHERFENNWDDFGFETQMAPARGSENPYAAVRDKANAHLDILRELGILSDSGAVLDTASSIAAIELGIANAARAEGLSENDILHPALVFSLPNKTKIWRKWGEPVPPLAMHYPGLLTTQDFNEMLAAGYFPVGDAQRANDRNRTFTAYEHDLAHITAFIQFPKMMKAVREQARSLSQQAEPSAEQARLSYFLSEGFLLVDPAMSATLSVAVSLPVESLDVATVSQLTNHILNLPKDSQNKFILKLTKLDSLISILGGAGREPINRNSYLHNIYHSVREGSLNRIAASRTRELSRENAETLARFTLIMNRLSHVTFEDWVPVFTTLKIKRSSPIARAFSWDVWSGMSHPFLTGTD